MPEKYNRLSLIRVLSERSADHHIVGLWLCDCGAETQINMSRVRNGYTKSCGCLGPETSRTHNRTHGMRFSKEYVSWRSMMDRCTNEDSKDYHRYGAAGITVAPELTSFEVFFAHIGPRPRGLTLDRIKNDKGYEIGNIRWATPMDQARNRRNSKSWVVKGLVFQTAQEAADHFGVSDVTIGRWVKGQQGDCHAINRY